MNPRRLAIASVTAALLGCAPAAAGEPTVVEMFTSQSCNSCPAAEALLAELADREGVIALEYHVDYWNGLTAGAAGRWRDPFSSHANTERQRDYNLAIRQRREVYTPQAIVDGRAEAVGSKRAHIERLIGARTGDRVAVDVRRAGDGQFVIGVEGNAAPAEIWLIRFDRRHVTAVPAGENKGKTLVNRNVVTEVRHVASWSGRPQQFAAALALPDGQGCAILVQPAKPGPIIGAARCPD